MLATILSSTAIAVSISLSLIAVLLSLWSLRRAEITQFREMRRDLNEIRADQLNDKDLQNRLMHAVRKIRNRLNGDDARAASKNDPRNTADEEPDADKDPEGWRQYMQRKYPQGALTGVPSARSK